MRRGNRHLVGVVLGGRSGGSRDAIMRNLLAENLEKGASKRTVAAITERNPADANTDVAETEAAARPAQARFRSLPQRRNRSQCRRRVRSPSRPSLPPQPQRCRKRNPSLKPRSRSPLPLTSGVIQSQALPAIPGSSEPMKPVRVKTVQVKAGPIKLASAGPPQPATPITNAISPARQEMPQTSGAVVAKAEASKTDGGKSEIAKTETVRNDVARTESPRTESFRPEMPPQPANHGTGHGLLGVLPASNAPPAQALAYADPTPRPQPQAVQQNGAIKPVAAHTGWIIQVGALESESEARQRIEAARNQARGLLAKAEPFTEPVVAKGDRKLYRARFAGLDRDQAEAVCRTLKRSDISCITVRN